MNHPIEETPIIIRRKAGANYRLSEQLMKEEKFEAEIETSEWVNAPTDWKGLALLAALITVMVITSGVWR